MSDYWDSRAEDIRRRRAGVAESNPALGLSVVPALDANPDEVAAARALARRSGMPLPLAQQDPKEAERAARIRELNLPGMEERSPGVARALMNPDLAQVAHDDVEKMWAIERYVRDIGQRFERGQAVNELGQLGFEALVGGDDPSREYRIRQLNAQQQGETDYQVDPGGAAGFVLGIPGATAEALPMLASGVKESVKFGVAGAAGGAAIGAGMGLTGGPAAPATVPAGAAAGALTGYGYGATVGLFVSSAKMEAGHSYLELRDMTDDQGRPIDRRLAGGLSLAVGVAAGSLETWGLGKLLSKVPGADKLTGAGMREAARRAVANPAFRRLASQFAGTMTESAITEGATEGAQELIAIGGELAAGLATGKGLEDFTFEAPGPDGQSIVLKGTDAILARVLASTVQGAQMGAGVAGAGQTARIITDSERARAAVAKLPGIERLTRSAQESKLRERDPEAFKAIVKQVAEEAKVDSVYVAPEAMRTYFESISPEEAQALAADIPAIGQQQEEVARTGADVRLSLEDWLAHPEMAEALRDHVRFDPLEMTHKEALGWQEDLERQVGDLQDVVEGAKTEKDALALVGEHMRAELLKVYPETVVGPMTEFIVDRYRTRAQRLGVPVAELVQQEGLPRIEGPHQGADQKGALPPTLEDKLGTIRDEQSVRRVLGDMRAKRLPKLTRGTPIVDLLRTRGGVRPDSVLAGELENMGFKRSGKGSFAGLITAKGTRDKFSGRRREPLGDLDNLVADEHPELAAVVGTDETGQYLSRQGLLDELARELRGESRVVDPMEQEAFDAAQAEQAAVQAVLDEMGVPLDQADDAVVAKLTQRFSSREFQQRVAETHEEAARTPEFKAWAGDAEVVLDPESHTFTEGQPVVVATFHGTTHDFDTIDTDIAAIESDLGRAFYSSTSRGDVDRNYAGIGPDLTGRLERETEYLEAVIPDDPTAYGLPEDADGVAIRSRAEALAREKLVGKAGEQGKVIPVFVKLEKPALFGYDRKSTSLIDLEGDYNEELDEFSDSENLLTIIDAAREAESNYLDFDADAFLGRLEEYRDRGAISAKQLVETVTSENYATTLDGSSLASNQIAQDILRALGFDGAIVIDAQERFRGMDIGENVQHVVVFEPTGKNVKAVQSQAFNPQSANIYREGHRGSIRMTDDLTEVIIRFTEAQDLSTFLHESGHLFLAQLEKDAARDEGQLDADLATVKDWARAQVGTDDLTSDAVHELWARSFEAYLMEGKAPSLSLERAFARFASWLVRIYKRLRGIPGYRDNLTPEIRGVMDRLLATDEQIAEAAEARGLAELDAQALGMTEEQAAKYREQVADGMGEAKRALQVQLMAQLERQKTREWKKLREEVRAEVEADVNSRPVFQAAHWLAKGEPLEGAPAPGLPEAKLDATALVELYGKEIKKALPRRYWAKEGLHPDVVAEAFGFPDGDALVRALEAAGNRADVIEAETDALMEKRHGTLQTSAQLEDAAVEALANAKQLRALKTAERAIAAKAGGKVIPIAITRATAQRLVRSTRYRDLTPARYRAAALKASRDVVRMIAKGEFPEAQTAIRQQILNLVMEAEARKAMTEADKAVDYLNRVQKRKSRERIGKAGADYLEQIDGMLERFDLRQHQSLRKIDRTTALAQWIAEQEAAGEEVIIPPKLRNEAFKQSWKELSIDDVLALRDAVKNVEHLARRKNEFLANRERRQREAVQTELVAAAAANLPGRRVPNDMTPGKVEQLRRTLLSAEGSLVKMEFLIDLLDGGDPMGPWRANVFTPIAEAQAERYDLSGEYTHRLGELMAELVKGREALFARKWAAPQTGNRVTMWNVIGIALNVGNEGNYRNLVEGNRLSEGAIKSLLDEHMTEADWTFVRETWKLIDSLWPRIAEQERRLTGVVPEKVTGRTVSTPFGEFEGGYFPIVRDPDKSEAARRNADKGLYDGIETAFQRAITGHGFTIERTGATGPLLLDLAVIPAHLDAVIHDLTHRDVLMQIDKLLAGKPIVDIFGESGRAELYRLFRPWLQGIAKDRIVENRALAGMAGLLRVLRANTSSFALGFRATTLAMQVSGHSNAYGLLREKLPNAGRWIGVGIKKAFAGGRINGMREHFANVLEVSGEMRHRIGNIDRDLRDVIRRNQGENTIPARVRTAAMELIGQMQMFAVDLPVWSGAYEGAVRELGYSHEDAVTFADSIIRMSQGAAGAKDLSAIQRADEGYKQFLTFFSYRNLVYNQIVSAGRRVRAPRDVGRFFATWAFSITIPFVYAALVRQAITGHGGLPGDDDDGPGDWIAWFIASNLAEFVGTAPYAAELAGVARAATGDGRFFISATPTQRVAEAVGDLAVPKDVTDVTFDALRVSAMLTGMPADWALKLSEDAIRESD